MQAVEPASCYISNLVESQKDDIYFKVAQIAADRFGVQGVKNAYHLAQEDLKIYSSDARNVLTHIWIMVKEGIGQRKLFSSHEQKAIFICKLFTALKNNVQLQKQTDIDLSCKCSFLIETFKRLNIPCDCCDFPYLYKVSIDLSERGYIIREYVFTYTQITEIFKEYSGKDTFTSQISNVSEHPLSPN